MLVVEAGRAPERVDRAVAERLGEVSRATVQRWIGEARVTVNGAACRARDPVAPGDRIEVRPGPRPASAARPEPELEVPVVFEDEHLLVVDKPAGMVVHPARGHASGTLVNGLLARPGFERAGADPGDPEGALRPGIVHRIDKDTSGLLMVAKDERTREGLKALLAAHEIERAYLALTVGVPRQATIRTLHARDPRSRLRFTSRTERGREAVTHVEVLEVLAAGRAALVRCRLETGRTHQIRVHLTERAGTPLLGDRLYSRGPISAPLVPAAAALGRQALHAAVLGFRHPVTGVALRFESPVPADFALAASTLRALA
ncbi:MAG: RluA family pseudouridine synthase [Polyangiaceae bacterium]|nr:RluA family pseudouridine synthase [Polyangiaceae bacterium]